MELNVGTGVFMYERAACHISHDYLNATFNSLLPLPTDSQTTTQRRARDTVLLLLSQMKVKTSEALVEEAQQLHPQQAGSQTLLLFW